MSIPKLLLQQFGRPRREFPVDQLIKAQVRLKATKQLRGMLAQDDGKHAEYINFFRETGGYKAIEAYVTKLDGQVTEMCEHCDTTRRSSKDMIPGASNPLKRLDIEIQNWAMAAVAIKLSRGLDIDAAFHIGQPFNDMVNNRDYVLAIVSKNAGEDGFGISISMPEFAKHTAPEITYMLMLQAQQDRFESDFWAIVSSEAGNVHAFEKVSRISESMCKGSLEYWAQWRRP